MARWLAAEHRLERVDSVDRVERVDSVDRVERVDSVDRIGLLDRLSVLGVLGRERLLGSVRRFLAVSAGLAVTIPAVESPASQIGLAQAMRAWLAASSPSSVTEVSRILYF